MVLVLLGVLALAGWLAYRFVLQAPAAPWEAAGLTMEERLALFAEMGDEGVFGPTLEQAGEMLRAAEGQKAQGKAHASFAAGKALLRRGDLERAVDTLGSLIGDLEGSRQTQAQTMLTDARALYLGAQLRLGEDRNCVRNHNADSCLLPIAGGGVHIDRGPMQAARRTLEQELERDPDSLIARWLLNVVAMTLGEWPEGVPPGVRLSPDLFAAEVDFPRFVDVGPSLGISPNELSGSPILDDFDGDGDVDVIASSMGLRDPLRFFRNEGDGRFTERTDAAGLSGQLGGLNCNQADYDNDGDLDVFVLRGGWMGNAGPVPNSLLRNRGDGTFEDVTEAAGLLTFHGTQAAAWADFDLDGWLDLFVGNESTEGTNFGHPSELWHNRGDGTFENVIASSGIELHSFTKGVTWGDVDEDGDPDLFVSRRDGPSRLYRNDTAVGAGAQPRFEDITRAAGIEVDRRDFPCWFFDYDNDGHLDLFVGGYGSEFNGESDTDPMDVIPSVRLGLEVDPRFYPQLWRNRGDGTFEDVAGQVGLQRVVLLMGANFGDLDNDGWLDLYLGTGHPDFRALMANRVFRNDRGQRFQDVTTAAGMGHLQKGHGIAFADIDRDGDQDVYAGLGGWYPADTFPNALYLNPGFNNRWITLHLEGRRSNRGAVGARIAVTIATPDGPRTIHRLVGSGGSFGSSSLAAEIGLGSATAIEACRVLWPGGEEQSIPGLALDSTYHLVEGEQPERLDVTPIPIRADGAQGSHHGSH